MQKAVFLFMVIMTMGMLSACANTVGGMGRDIENAGQSIQNL